MPKVTLYVPDELKARMDEVGEGENWSAIAQRAFREAVILHNVTRKPHNMSNVIERLRASKQAVEDRDRAAGKERGIIWAQTSAQYDQLKRVSKNEISTHIELKKVIDPLNNMGAEDWHVFWSFPSYVAELDAFVEGFIEGAREVYDEVVDEL